MLWLSDLFSSIGKKGKDLGIISEKPLIHEGPSMRTQKYLGDSFGCIWFVLTFLVRT